MSTILYFAFALLCASAIAEDSLLQLYVDKTNLTHYQHGNHYYSVKGENVSLGCKYSNGQSSITLNFNKGLRAENASWIYSGGMLRPYPPGKYSEKEKSGQTLLNIYNVGDDDSALYACWYSQKNNNTNARVLFNFVNLYVLQPNMKPSFCVLHQNTSGIFHPQDDLVLRCPSEEGQLEIKFSNKDASIDLNCSKSLEQNFCTINVTKVTSALNGKQISCTKSNGDIQCDLCRQIPRLTVIDDLVVHVEVKGGQNSKGRFALLTCTSFPSLLSRIQWHVEDNNLLILNNTLRFNQLRIVNRTSPNATKINFKVTCKITIGKMSNSTTVNVNYTFDPSSPSGEDVAMSTTLTTSFTSEVAPLSPRSPSLAGIIVSATVIPILVIVSILLICCFRSSKSATVKGDSSGGGTDNLRRDTIYEDKDSRIQLGLSPDNSQVAENVLYEPHRGNNI